MDFSLDDFLIGSANEEDIDGLFFYKISLIVDDGKPELVATTVNEDMDEISCDGMSFAPDGTLYCMNSDGLSEIDLELGTITSVGNPELEGSEGLGLAVGSDGTIYIGDEIGLYSYDLLDETTTQLVKWDNDGDEVIDEPNATDDNPALEPLECSATASMDFDSEGSLYAIMFCDEVPVLAKIGLDPLTVIAYSSELDEDTEQANLTLIAFLERNDDLSDIYSLGDMELFDPITFSPIDFDFLLGNTYGEVISGFDSITAVVTEDGNFIATDDTAEISICDNAELSLDGAELFVECNNTSVSVESGSVVATLIPDDEEIEQLATTLSSGDAIVFDSLECELTNTGENDIDVDFEGEITTVVPNDTFSCLKPTDHYLGYDVKDETRHHDDEHDDHDHDGYGHDDDHKAKDSKKHDDDHKAKDSKKHEKVIVNLVDEFAGNVNYQIKKAQNLFNPVDKNGEGIGSEESHLVSYDLKKIKGEPKFEKIKNILVTNQFGDLIVDIKHPKQLLVPSAKSHDTVPEELEKIVINHFKCYDAKESKKTPKFEERTVDLEDQFGSVTMKVHKVQSLCSPVDKNGEGIVNEENYLMCYDLKKIKGEPKFKKINVFTNNQFGPEEFEVKKPNELCVPSEVLLP